MGQPEELIWRGDAVKILERFLEQLMMDVYPQLSLIELGVEMQIEKIDDLPAVQPEEQVVRCKDCVYRDDPDSSPAWIPCRYMSLRDNWFCADGKRREEDGERPD